MNLLYLKIIWYLCIFLINWQLLQVWSTFISKLENMATTIYTLRVCLYWLTMYYEVTVRNSTLKRRPTAHTSTASKSRIFNFLPTDRGASKVTTTLLHRNRPTPWIRVRRVSCLKGIFQKCYFAYTKLLAFTQALSVTLLSLFGNVLGEKNCNKILLTMWNKSPYFIALSRNDLKVNLMLIWAVRERP